MNIYHIDEKKRNMFYPLEKINQEIACFTHLLTQNVGK